MKIIHIIYQKYSELLKNTDQRKLAKYLKYVGFDNLAHSLYPQVGAIENITWHSYMCVCKIFYGMFSELTSIRLNWWLAMYHPVYTQI